jgi:hypothetical protein
MLVAALFLCIFKAIDIIVATDQCSGAIIGVEKKIGQIGHHEFEIILLQLCTKLVKKTREYFCDVLGVEVYCKNRLSLLSRKRLDVVLF